MSTNAGKFIALSVGIFVLSACTGEVDSDPPTPVSHTPSVRIALASTDLSLGLNRVAFGLMDVAEGPVRDAEVQLSSFFLNGDVNEGPIETTTAVWRQWPLGDIGIYTTNLSFDRVGRWGILTRIETSNGVQSATASLDVKEQSFTPMIGSVPPMSTTKLAADYDDLKEITSDLQADPELYAITVRQGLEAGIPLVVIFSTPSYCRTATCGPQLEIIKILKTEYAKRVNFVHVELYENPSQLEGDLSNAVLANSVIEWALPSEPWTFVMDSDGATSAKFEGFVTRAELDSELLRVLKHVES